MKKVTFLVLILVAFAMSANAQMALNKPDPKAGFASDTISDGGLWWEDDGGKWKAGKYNFPTLADNYHFNSNLANTSYAPGVLGSLQKATTVKGVQVIGYDDTRKVKFADNSGTGKMDNYTGAQNPVVFDNVTTLRSYLIEQSSVDSLVGAVLALDGVGGPESNRALAAYPGKWKKTDTRIQINANSDSVMANFAFTLIPLAPGNDVAVTTTYKVIVSGVQWNGGSNINAGDLIDDTSYGTDGTIAADGGRRWVFENVLTVNNTTPITDSIRFNVNERINVPYGELSQKRFTVAIIAESTGAVTPGTYAPFAVIDNISIGWKPGAKNQNLASWINENPFIVALDAETAALVVAETKQLVSTVTDAEGDAPKESKSSNVIWASSNDAVATVVDGLVTGVADGVADITATMVDGGKVATCRVTVGAGGSDIADVAVSSTKILGQEGQIEIIDAQAPVTVYNLTGQKVAVVAQGNQVIPVSAGVYLVAEQNQRTVKVLVK